MKRKCRNSTVSLSNVVLKMLRIEKENDEKVLGVKITWDEFFSRFLRKRRKGGLREG